MKREVINGKARYKKLTWVPYLSHFPLIEPHYYTHPHSPISQREIVCEIEREREFARQRERESLRDKERERVCVIKRERTIDEQCHHHHHRLAAVHSHQRSSQPLFIRSLVCFQSTGIVSQILFGFLREICFCFSGFLRDCTS